MTTEQLSKAIRAYLEAVLATADAAGTMCASEQNPGFFVLDGISSNPIYVGRKSAAFIAAARTVTPQMARALLLVLEGMDEWNRGDGYSPRAELLIRDIARELGIEYTAAAATL